MFGNQDFCWRWSPARGHSGGLITGVKMDSFEIEHSEETKYFMCILIRNRTTDHRFWLVNVYGPAQHEYLEHFI